MKKLEDTIELDIIDLDKTGALPDKLEFEGEITYTDADIEAGLAAKEISADIESTKVIPNISQEELTAYLAAHGEAATETMGNTRKDYANVEEVSYEAADMVYDENNNSYDEKEFDDNGYNDEELDEADDNYTDDPEDEYLNISEEEEEKLGDLTYHDSDDDIRPSKKAKRPIRYEEDSYDDEYDYDDDDDYDYEEERRRIEQKKRENARRRAELQREQKKVNAQSKKLDKKSAQVDKNAKSNARRESEFTGKNSQKSKNGNDEHSGGFFAKLNWMDGVIAATAIIVVAILVIVAVNVVGVDKKPMDSGLSEDFVKLGTMLAEMDSIGNDSIDAFIAKAGEDVVTVEEPVEVEQETKKAEDISVAFTSVEKDLKIKFTNVTTGKLATGVKFEVNVTTPKKKNLTWTDDDMDGTIYQKDLVAGDYQVVIKSVGDYHFPDTPTKVKVKDKITYVAINVVDEIKTEADINAAIEDLQNTAVVDKGAVLSDTVGWVDSTKTVDQGEDGYAEIKKDTITDPTTINPTAFRNDGALFTRTTALDPTPEPEPLPPTEPPTEPPTAPPTPTATPTPAPTATPTPTPTATPAPTAPPTPTATPTPAPTATPTPAPTATPTLTPVAKNLKINIAEGKHTILVGESWTLTVSVTGNVTNKGVTFYSTVPGVATVDNNGLIKAVAVGTTEIQVKTQEKDDKGAQLSASCIVEVKSNPKLDTTTLLKDKNGKQVYIKTAEGGYKEAHWADYFTAEKFYIQSEVIYKYTGWQTINGSTFYFDANGNKVTGEQVINGVKYNFASDGSLSMNGGTMGIDVSKWQSSVDWNAVKNSGISYVIIRCGYRGSSTGVLVKDPKFASFASGANKAGLKVGLYFFTQAINEVEAVEEASMCLSLAKNYKISYPIFIDTEKVSNGRANSLDVSTRTAVCRAFCETIKSGGYTPGIYGSKSWFEKNLNMSSLNSYKIWLAQYASSPTYGSKYDLWQYSSTGRVSGISGNVDVNISYLGY